MVRTDGGELGIGLRHESLQLFLEQLVSSLGGCRLHGGALGTVLAEITAAVLIAALTGLAVAVLLETAFFPAGNIVIAEISAFPAGGIFTLGLGLQTLDGQGGSCRFRCR